MSWASPSTLRRPPLNRIEALRSSRVTGLIRLRGGACGCGSRVWEAVATVRAGRFEDADDSLIIGVHHNDFNAEIRVHSARASAGWGWRSRALFRSEMATLG